MVVNGNRKNLLGFVLTDNVFIQVAVDFFWLWKLDVFKFFSGGCAEFFLNDLVAKLDALVTDVNTWTGN
jgi:hypothetical protein